MHTPLCFHAEGQPTEYVARGAALGLDEIGFSEHAPMSSGQDGWHMDLEKMPDYIESVERARTDHPDVPVRIGLECDYFPGEEEWIAKLAEMHEWDYLIGSVHYVSPVWAVDDPDPKWVGHWDSTPVEDVWRDYWDRLAGAAVSGLFDFVGHPDLVKIFNRVPAGDLRPYYEATIAALAKSGTAIEINTAGLRKPVGELYPAPEFLTMACEAGIGLTINSDAHKPTDVARDFDKARDLARACGFDRTLRFERRQKTFAPLD
jgi:histidinol-phosphatase (PHP family)